jgi:glutamyl-tRNA synthetase
MEIRRMGDKVRVRFAPSPSGYLHVGGARAALFNWLFARQQGGTFILRIEDTNVEKSSAEMVDAITNGIRWLGMDWDEGPYFQSKRVEKHREAAVTLLENGRAYRCFCPRVVLDEERKAAEKRGETYVYSGQCRDLSENNIADKLAAGEPFVLRFLAPPGETIFHDEVYGEVAAGNSTIGDFILARIDGNPTYHLAVVVDDIDMEISHVIRGEDHRQNTLKHVLLFEALGHRPPVFAHLPLILGSDKRKLSKRHGATAVGVYEEEGILPEALFNFLALLGWSPGTDEEIMNREEMVKEFSLKRVIKKSAIFDPKKLEWMNSQYFSSCSIDRLNELVSPLLEEEGLLDPSFLGEKRESYNKILILLRDRAHRLGDFVEHGRPFFTDDFEYNPKDVAKRWKSPATMEFLTRSRDAFLGLEKFTCEQIEASVRSLAEELDVSASKLIHPVRVAVTGKAVGPGLFQLLEVVGRDKTVERINLAVDYLESHPDLFKSKEDRTE